MGTGEGGQFAACGEAHDADTVRVDTELSSAAFDDLDGALGVGERSALDGVGGFLLAGEPVLEDKTGYSMLAEPFGQIVAFVVHPKRTVAAARRNHDAGPGGCFFGR